MVMNAGALFVTVHWQVPALAVMFVLPVVWAIPADSEFGEIENEQPDDWLTVKVCPATVSVPLRSGPELAAMLKFTVPLPLPDAPDVIVRKDELLDAFHAHPAGVVTDVLLELEPAPAARDIGLIENVQPPACVTVNVCPAIVSVPVRCGPELDPMLKVVVPFPLPDAPVCTVMNAALLDALHVQPAPAVTLLLPDPLPAPTD